MFMCWPLLPAPSTWWLIFLPAKTSEYLFKRPVLPPSLESHYPTNTVFTAPSPPVVVTGTTIASSFSIDARAVTTVLCKQGKSFTPSTSSCIFASRLFTGRWKNGWGYYALCAHHPPPPPSPSSSFLNTSSSIPITFLTTIWPSDCDLDDNKPGRLAWGRRCWWRSC